jgi:hypothetical protein
MGKGSGKEVLGGPKVHFTVHIACLVAMIGGAVWELITQGHGKDD